MVNFIAVLLCFCGVLTAVCVYLLRELRKAERNVEWYTNTVNCLSDENLSLAQRLAYAPKRPRRIYRSRSTLLTDDESDALWASIMGDRDA